LLGNWFVKAADSSHPALRGADLPICYADNLKIHGIVLAQLPSPQKGTVALPALEFGVPEQFGAKIGAFEILPETYYASARSQSCLSDLKFRYRPRPSENCRLRI
jgi:hypothetical protein